ncbi:MAG: hypothetical protein ACREQ9_06670, partial [Candidatus Binatia bacterium]
MEALATSLILAVFTAGIALTFYVADREAPTSRALVALFAVMPAIFLLSGLRRAELVPALPLLWERVG